MKEMIAKSWHQPLTLAIASGIMLGLSFPPLPFPFLAFLGFFLLLRVVDLSDSPRQAALYAWIGFVIWNLIVTYWLMMATLSAGIAAIIANAAVMTLPVMMQKKTQEWFTHPVAIALLQAAWWVGFEFLHHHWDLAWPWLSLGNAWSNTPVLVQYISATGYLGISFWVAAVSALAYRLYKVRDRRRPLLRWGALGLLLVLPCISLLQFALRGHNSTEYVETVVTQPNFDSYQEYGGYETPVEAIDRIRDQADSLVNSYTELVLWPENGIHPALISRPTSYTMETYTRNILTSWADKGEFTLVGGTTYFEYFDPGSAPPLPMHSEEGRPYLAFNSAVAFTPDGELRVYRKHHLVPMVERIPFVHALNAIDFAGLVNWSAIQGYGKGQEPTTFSAGPTRIPALVCYDSVFPGWVRKFVKEGAGILTVITNDGWWGETGGHLQHFAYARLRAIEFQRYLVRSANNGISGVIGPRGQVLEKTEYWERDAFRYNVPVIDKQTLYARFGDWLPLLCLLAGGGSVGLALFRRFR